jgi:hypothetical protein
MLQKGQRRDRIRPAAVFAACTKLKQYLLFFGSRRYVTLSGAVLTPRSLLVGPSVEVNSCKPEPEGSAFTIVDDFIAAATATTNSWRILLIIWYVIVESVCDVLFNEAVGAEEYACFVQSVSCQSQWRLSMIIVAMRSMQKMWESNLADLCQTLNII